MTHPSAPPPSTRPAALRRGMKDGLPIAFGYLAVAFSLGIAAKNAGLTAFQSFLASLLCNASAGEYAGFTVIAARAGLLEMAIITFVANARYLLMSTAMSQRMDPKCSGIHRIFMAFFITDEFFAINIARPGYLEPFYMYGAILVASPCWAVGTALGCMAGELLPGRLVSALSVALYGMFLAVIVPAARKDKVVLGLIVAAFGASFACSVLPGISALSEGTRTIVLTVALSAVAAALFPRPSAEEEIRARQEEKA